ncbi:hypothetical protein JHK84_054915 [Glycine max]|nr:hypothetical protein JHK84_054915 [Glycine max]
METPAIYTTVFANNNKITETSSGTTRGPMMSATAISRWRNQFGSRTAIDPVANYAYGNIGSGGYGAPPTGEPYAGPNYAASGFEYSTAYGTIGAAPV